MVRAAWSSPFFQIPHSSLSEPALLGYGSDVPARDDHEEDAVALLATQMNGYDAGAKASRTVALSSTLSGLLLLLIRP